MPLLQDIVYAAGFVDADGSIGVYSGKSRPRVVIQITSKKSYIPAWFKYTFGGNFYHYIGSGYTQGKTYYRWIIYDKHARNLATLLEPFLKEKKGQAILIQKFPIGTRCNHLTEDEKVLRDDIYFEIRRLNNSAHLLLREG